MKVKTKLQKVPLTGGASNEELAELFNQMIGAGGVNVTIVYPKYVRLKSNCDRFITIFEKLARSQIMSSQLLSKSRDEILKYCENARKIHEETFSMSLAEYEWNLDLANKDLIVRDKFTKVYENVKQSECLKIPIKLYDALFPYGKNFSSMKNLSHKFITTMPGVEWSPLPFTSLNIKDLFTVVSDENIKRLFMTVLCRAYEFSGNIYNEWRSPDVDVDKFVEVIMCSIDKLKSRSELSKCGKAFAKIKESVSLLKTNFSQYYENFITTGDQTIIMENFILDVSKNTQADAQTANQFRMIVQYYHKISQNQPKNDKVQALIKRVSESFNQMDGTKNLSRGTIIQADISEDCEDSGEDSNIIGAVNIRADEFMKKED